MGLDSLFIYQDRLWISGRAMPNRLCFTQLNDPNCWAIALQDIPKGEVGYVCITGQDVDIWDTLSGEEVEAENDKCECGAETVYGEDTVHSEWCPRSNKGKKK